MSWWMPWTLLGALLLALLGVEFREASYRTRPARAAAPSFQAGLALRKWAWSMVALMCAMLISFGYGRWVWQGMPPSDHPQPPVTVYPKGTALAIASLFPISAYVAFALASAGFAAARAGYLFRIDAHGLRHSQLPAIAWGQVEDLWLDDQWTSNGRLPAYLCLMLDDRSAAELKSHCGSRVSFCKPFLMGRTLHVGLAWTREGPEQVLTGVQPVWQRYRAAAVA